MMKRTLTLLSLLVCTVFVMQAQTYNEMTPDGNISQRNEYGTNSNFNPNKRDSVKGNVEIPIGVRVWKIDRRFGDVIPAEPDTMPHLYQNSIYATGRYGEFNTLGNNFTARQNRIFIDRPETSEFFFTQPYSFTTKEPDEFLFVNTLSPYAHVSYESCGDKQNGEDHIDAKFATNVNKKFGFGFDLDYHYATGYFEGLNNSHFRAALFGSYIGDQYQAHMITSFYHRKASENGGIINDEYITHPEAQESTFTEQEIPTVLSSNWNRNNSQQIFFSHRYNLGFYRKVKMTDEEIKARQFAQKSAREKEEREGKKDRNASKTAGRGANEKIAGDQPSGRPANAQIMGDEPVQGKPQLNDSTRIKVESQAELDSLKRAKEIEDSIESTMKREFVPVTSFIHTVEVNNHDRIYQAYDSPTGYYEDIYYQLNDEGTYGSDSIYDKNKYLSVKNTFAVALLEGFNKYMKAGLKGFISYETRKYQMPEYNADSTGYVLGKRTGHCLNVGGQLSRTQGDVFHFNLAAELGVTGMNSGGIKLDFNTDLNFRLFGDTLTLAAKAYFHRLVPSAFMTNYHSKHLWWDESLDKETRTHVEGIFRYRKTDTQLRLAITEIQNYTFFGMAYTVDSDYNREGLTAGVYQEDGNIHLMTAQLMQNLSLGILHWDNVVTYQSSSNQEVLPLPKLNLFSNLYLKFKIAHVLDTEIGASLTYFTKYTAPDYLPQLNQFAIQIKEESRVELGGYPWVDVYANFHLKRARFFVAMTHVNAGSGTKMQFLTPHYPTNNRTLHLGVSWNFFN